MTLSDRVTTIFPMYTRDRNRIEPVNSSIEFVSEWNLFQRNFTVVKSN